VRAVVQRVTCAKVEVDQKITGEIGRGFLVLLGVEEGDGQNDLDYIVRKISGMRVFEDEQGKMNKDIRDVQGSLLVVSQFTLLGDARHGRRPSFTAAASPEQGNYWYEQAVAAFRELGFHTQTGVFQADMQVSLTNDGPVTMLLDSRKIL